MSFTEHPRLLARVAGLFYMAIIASAIFAYIYVRGQVIIPGDMAQTAANILAHERLYRLGFSSAVITVICNPPMGLINNGMHPTPHQHAFYVACAGVRGCRALGAPWHKST